MTVDSPSPVAATFRTGPAQPAAGAAGGERLALTVVFSAMLHGVILLGVGFSAAQAPSAPPMLDVILVATSTRDKPDKADFLAQANQEGGGDLDHPERPTAVGNAPTLKPDPGEAEQIQEAAAPRAATDAEAPVLTTSAAAADVASSDTAPQNVPSALPESDELRELQREIAALAAEQDRRRQDYAQRPNKKFVTAQTQEYFYAAYVRAWDLRIERLSNDEYPAQFARHRLHGELIMAVEIRADGSVAHAEIVNSSGHRVLDESALQIVRRAAPYPALPRNPDERVDILHITRTWQFLPSGVVRQR